MFPLPDLLLLFLIVVPFPLISAQLTLSGTLTQCSSVTLLDQRAQDGASGNGVGGSNPLWQITVYLQETGSGVEGGNLSPAETISCFGSSPCQWIVDMPAGSSVSLCSPMSQSCTSDLISVLPGRTDSCLAANIGASSVAISSQASALSVSSVSSVASVSSASVASISSASVASASRASASASTRASSSSDAPPESGTPVPPPPSDSGGGGSNHTGAIAGGVVGGVVGVGLILAAILYYCRRRQRQDTRRRSAQITIADLGGETKEGKSEPGWAQFVSNSDATLSGAQPPDWRSNFQPGGGGDITGVPTAASLGAGGGNTRRHTWRRSTTGGSMDMEVTEASPVGIALANSNAQRTLDRAETDRSDQTDFTGDGAKPTSELEKAYARLTRSESENNMLSSLPTVENNKGGDNNNNARSRSLELNGSQVYPYRSPPPSMPTTPSPAHSFSGPSPFNRSSIGGGGNGLLSGLGLGRITSRRDSSPISHSPSSRRSSGNQRPVTTRLTISTPFNFQHQHQSAGSANSVRPLSGIEDLTTHTNGDGEGMGPSPTRLKSASTPTSATPSTPGGPFRDRGRRRPPPPPVQDHLNVSNLSVDAMTPPRSAGSAVSSTSAMVSHGTDGSGNGSGSASGNGNSPTTGLHKKESSHHLKRKPPPVWNPDDENAQEQVDSAV